MMKEKKILHLVTDEKFTDYAIKQFEAPEMHSEFVLIPSNYGSCEDIVKNIDKCRIVLQNSPEFKILLTKLSQYSAIVFHGILWRWCEDVMKAVPEKVKVAWCFWGGEIYSRREVHRSFLAPVTRFLYALHNIKKNNEESSIWQLPMELYQRIDYCVTDIDEEFAYAKKYVHSNRMQQLRYNYYSLEETIGPLTDKRCNGNNLWFCNSAANSNNMFDAMLRLLRSSYKKHLKDSKIIMPVSYGEPWIKNMMLKYGPMCFGEKFIPLKDYLPLEDYNKLMLSCSTLVLPYYFPAGQGNIITAMWLGLRVYLSDKSMAFDFFKRIGCVVFSFESDFQRYGCKQLTDEEVMKNRMILKEMYGKENMMLAVQNVVDVLTSSDD